MCVTRLRCKESHGTITGVSGLQFGEPQMKTSEPQREVWPPLQRGESGARGKKLKHMREPP